ncbi:hypothetical protein K501DRAFT_285179 [Backusella circina FSU 941]|nr:hypothetical protein K501DRAFT_285179 [Backusella circina FSU 941]
MTQKSCKSSPEPNVTEEEVLSSQIVSPKTSSGNEAAEMVEAVLSMSDHDQQPNEQDDEESDNESFWTYEEYAIIKEYYENEDNDQEEEEQELLIMTEIKSDSDQSN